MEAIAQQEKRKNISFKSQTVCEDTQETIFEEMFNLYLSGKISYDQLLEEYPDHDSSLFRKILRKILRIIN